MGLEHQGLLAPEVEDFVVREARCTINYNVESMQQAALFDLLTGNTGYKVAPVLLVSIGYHVGSAFVTFSHADQVRRAL
jgi:hypothetical protein